jgi:superfamily II DNA helicase RecQ
MALDGRPSTRRGIAIGGARELVALEEIARQRLKELWQLAKVSGVGPTKLERYGDEVLQALAR